MDEPDNVTDVMLENAVKHHSDKIGNPKAVRTLVDLYLPATSPRGDVTHVPQSRRNEFLVELAKLE